MEFLKDSGQPTSTMNGLEATFNFLKALKSERSSGSGCLRAVEKGLKDVRVSKRIGVGEMGLLGLVSLC